MLAHHLKNLNVKPLHFVNAYNAKATGCSATDLSVQNEKWLCQNKAFIDKKDYPKSFEILINNAYYVSMRDKTK